MAPPPLASLDDFVVAGVVLLVFVAFGWITHVIECRRLERLARQLTRERDEARVRAEGLRGLVEDALEVARIGPGEPAAAREAVSLAEAAREAVGRVAPLAERLDVAVKEQPPAFPDLWAQADPALLKRALTRLLSGSVRYNRCERGVIVRWGEAGEGRVMVAVVTDGPNPPADAVGAEDASASLALGRRLAELAGGVLETAGAPGETSLALTLPRSPAPPPTPEEGPPAVEVEGPDARRGAAPGAS